jgi:hypothetical protein
VERLRAGEGRSFRILSDNSEHVDLGSGKAAVTGHMFPHSLGFFEGRIGNFS